VLAGPDFPLKVSQLNSMFMEFGTLMFGKMAYSCIMIAKSLSARGLYGSLGCMMNAPIMPIISCIAMCEW
jgi:hypothetical protein